MQHRFRVHVSELNAHIKGMQMCMRAVFDFVFNARKDLCIIDKNSSISEVLGPAQGQNLMQLGTDESHRERFNLVVKPLLSVACPHTSAS